MSYYHHLRYHHDKVEAHSVVMNESGLSLLYDDGTTVLLQLGRDGRWRAILVVKHPDAFGTLQPVSTHSVFKFVNASDHSGWLEEA